MTSSLYKANATYLLDSCAANTNPTTVKASSAELYNIHAFNAAASTRYLKIYNTASAPTVGTTVPVLTFGIAAGATLNVSWAKGLYLGTGLSFGIVTGAANANTTAPSAADVTGLSISYA